MQGAYCQTAKPEAVVGGDEDGAGGGGGEAADGEDIDGGVVEDGPTAGHEALLGEAAEEDAAGFEDSEGNDGIGDEEGFGEDEEDEGDQRKEDREELDCVGEAVEEEYDGCGLGMLVR